jgi:hypothetical protein
MKFSVFCVDDTVHNSHECVTGTYEPVLTTTALRALLTDAPATLLLASISSQDLSTDVELEP